MSEAASTLSRIGAVVIGRNEGARLERCLRSLVDRVALVVYVDSGSSDGSVALSRRLNAEVVELDMTASFTAARARNAGFDRLCERMPDVELVQFVDGDCEVVAEWLEIAARRLRDAEQLAVVCGRRRERFPEASVYNRLCDIEWDTPIGARGACGGDALMRVEALRAAGGYDATLIAGEEPELCLRLRRSGWRIERLDAEMTLHDAAIVRFGQWWRRAMRSGYAFAEGAWRYGRGPERYNVRALASIVAWAAVLPALVAALAWPTRGLSLLLLLAVVVPWRRMVKQQGRRGRLPAGARAYATYTLLAKLPQLQGIVAFGWRLIRGGHGRLIEYKSVEADEKAGGGGPALMYLSAVLPSLSETFVYNEVFRLRDAGVRVLTASVHAPERGLGTPRLERLAQETRGVYGSGMLVDAGWELIAHPLRGAATLLLAVSDAPLLADLPLRRRPRVLWQALASFALAAPRTRRQGVGHIHAHMAHVPTTIAMYAARQAGVGFSFTGHANDIFQQRTLLSQKLKRAAFCACISHWHRAFYRDAASIPDTRLPVIRCGVDIPAESDRHETGGSVLHVVAVGRLIEKKGFDVLVRAPARLVKNGVSLTCDIVGDGPQRDALQLEVDGAELAEHVQLLGAHSNDDVRRRVQTADLFVLPCRVDPRGDRDGIPAALMEAMAAGVCTVSGDLPAIRELIDDGVTGRLVTPGDEDALAATLTALAGDEAQRARLGAAGRDWVRREFSADVNTRRLLEAFRSCGALPPVVAGRDTAPPTMAESNAVNGAPAEVAR